MRPQRDVALFTTVIRRTLAGLADELIELRRDLHAHPELAGNEVRTSTVVADRLIAAGIRVRLLAGSGLVADIGPADPAYRVALRADLDALPVAERTGLPFASVNEGVCHACGHDLHIAAVLGAGLALHQNVDSLAAQGTGVRLIFQPAEEVIPGGAQQVIRQGGIEGVDAIFSVHCDPTLDVGHVGLHNGPLTAAADGVTITLSGRGGHTARPHLTQDLTYALAKVVTDVPAVLSRRVDPRAGVALVWGSLHSGSAPNVIPSAGTVAGTLRMLDAQLWDEIGPLLEEVVHAVVSPYAVSVKVEHVRGVPPVVNDPSCVKVLRCAAVAAIGPDAPRSTLQSLGGEDFAWYVQEVPGAMARLGTRTPGGATYDLHQGDIIVDERAAIAGATLLAVAAMADGAK
ncbi:MAG TPA: amidohydrolase [Dermatophilaceae bacterium]